MEHSLAGAAVGEVGGGVGVSAVGREVADDVGGVGGDGDGGVERDFLPAGGGLAGEGGGGEEDTGGGPEVSDVGSGVSGAFVEADAVDGAGGG